MQETIISIATIAFIAYVVSQLYKVYAIKAHTTAYSVKNGYKAVDIYKEAIKNRSTEDNAILAKLNK